MKYKTESRRDLWENFHLDDKALPFFLLYFLPRHMYFQDIIGNQKILCNLKVTLCSIQRPILDLRGLTCSQL